MQATTLTFVIVAAAIGSQTGKLSSTTASALVAAGLLSAALFPAGAERLLARGRRPACPSSVGSVSRDSSKRQPAREPGSD
jgi:hypothetical protein